MIPKEAPWKTSALNERTTGSANLVSVTSGMERERGFVGTFPPPSGNLSQNVKKYLTN